MGAHQSARRGAPGAPQPRRHPPAAPAPGDAALTAGCACGRRCASASERLCAGCFSSAPPRMRARAAPPRHPPLPAGSSASPWHRRPGVRAAPLRAGGRAGGLGARAVGDSLSRPRCVHPATATRGRTPPSPADPPALLAHTRTARERAISSAPRGRRAGGGAGGRVSDGGRAEDRPRASWRAHVRHGDRAPGRPWNRAPRPPPAPVVTVARPQTHWRVWGPGNPGPGRSAWPATAGIVTPEPAAPHLAPAPPLRSPQTFSDAHPIHEKPPRHPHGEPPGAHAPPPRRQHSIHARCACPRLPPAAPPSSREPARLQGGRGGGAAAGGGPGGMRARLFPRAFARRRTVRACPVARLGESPPAFATHRPPPLLCPPRGGER